jgi:hypothetical protein
MGLLTPSDNDILPLRGERLAEVAAACPSELSPGQGASQVSNSEPGPGTRVGSTLLAALIVISLVLSATIGAMFWQGLVSTPRTIVIVRDREPREPQQASTTRPAAAADPKTALISRPDETGRVADLIAHGQKMLDLGQISPARAYFERAAEAGSADAAYALGMTYDPIFINDSGVQGMKADPAEARAWYERARDLGSQAAKGKLEELKHAVKERFKS